MTLPTSQLLPNPCQPRVDMDNDALVILSRSVARCGVLQPIPVRPSAAMQGKYEIVAGERRWRAARLAGLDEVPVIVRDATDEEMLELALVENIQREDLNTIDRAKAYRELRDRFGLGPDEVGERVGEDRSTVTNYLRLLDLAEPIQALVAGAQLSMGHARCLLGVADPERRERLARSAVDNELSVRALEEIVRREKTGRGVRPADGAATPRELSPHIADLQHRFEDALKTKVTIREARAKGRGRIVIEYFSLDDFDRIAQKLGVGLE
ncbi:MAG: ParB/RepB/Spo0J family partition protein [Phycisphaerae bacterium]